MWRKEKMMKERPILFSGPMVRALLNGTKTQTRRVIHPLCQLHESFCPYGQPGDRLWVRETWRTSECMDSKAPRDFAKWPVKYEADGAILDHGAFFGGTTGKTRVSIHMPRWASRLTLEITEVRVERLNEMSGEDAYEEGTQTWVEENLHLLRDGNKWASQKHAFQALWESINGPGSWALNPWVWVVGFKRVEGGAK